MTATPNPANLLGLDYRQPGPLRLPGLPIVDCHTHLRGDAEALRTYFQAAELYGIRHILSMTAWPNVPAVRDALASCKFPGRLEFIAVPDFRRWTDDVEFQQSWLADVRRFAQAGSRICKFWGGPAGLAEHHLTLDSPWLRPIIDAALDAGLSFMVHVADPDLWFGPTGRYADAAKYGTKPAAHRQLEWFVQYVAPRPVIGAHFLGHPEDLDHLDDLFARYPQLMLDTSATKWIAREISRQDRDRVLRFFRQNYQRIVFGSDLVLGPDYDFDHYASRYWVQRRLWESDYEGFSPIEDPDAPDGVHMHGLHLPDDILRAIYHDNYFRLVERIETMRISPR